MFQSLFSWNLPLMSGFFSSFFLFLSVKPAFSRPPAGMSVIYQMPYKFIPASALHRGFQIQKQVMHIYFSLATTP